MLRRALKRRPPPTLMGRIEISGKVVEEVGFERIRKQQAVLQELKIVVLDGLRICGVGKGVDVAQVQNEIFSTCPNITELDLSRNLFEDWKDVADICASLKKLRSLKARYVSDTGPFGSSKLLADSCCYKRTATENFRPQRCIFFPDSGGPSSQRLSCAARPSLW